MYYFINIYVHVCICMCMYLQVASVCISKACFTLSSGQPFQEAKEFARDFGKSVFDGIILSLLHGP